MIRFALDVWAFMFLAGLAAASAVGIAYIGWHARKLLLAAGTLLMLLALYSTAPMLATALLAAILVLPIIAALAKLTGRTFKRRRLR